MKMETANILVSMLREVDKWDAEIMEDYSGRCMFGQTTTAITDCSLNDILMAVCKFIVDNDNSSVDVDILNAFEEVALGLRTDSLGKGQMVY